LLGCLTAALVGDRVTRALRVHHPTYPAFPQIAASLPTLGRCALIGVGCGLVALAFVWLSAQIRHHVQRVAWAPLRPALGGLAVIAMVALVGNRDYLGLSGALTDTALAGASIASLAFAGKLIFTAVTLGSGFQGGEVTPLFVIGTTFAAAAGPHIGLPAAVAAAIGFSATFGAAANTPITCTVLAADLFGSAVLPFAAVACVVAFACSTRRSIYAAQRWALSP
jgi:H+/Cl- antiporter ClcA